MDIKITLEQPYQVENVNQIGTVKVVMLKGEKGVGGTASVNGITPDSSGNIELSSYDIPHDNSNVGDVLDDIENGVFASGSSTTSGSEAHLVEAAEGTPIEIIANIVSAQAGTGAPTPENARDIIGHTGLTITQRNNDNTVSKELNVSWQDEAGVVYGGTLNVLTGELTITKVGVIISGTNVNVGTLSIGTNGNRCGFQIIGLSAGYNITDMLCNIGTTDSTVNSDNAENWQLYTCYMYRSGNGNIFFRYVFPSSVTSNTDALQYLIDNNCKIVYTLPNAITYQIEAHEVLALLGDNYITANTGDVTAVYKTGFASTISALINQIESLKQRVTTLENA